MKLVLRIDLAGAAFEDSGDLEVARILRTEADAWDRGDRDIGQDDPRWLWLAEDRWNLRDLYGNTCGSCALQSD